MGQHIKGNSPAKAGELVRRLLIGFFLGLVLGMHSHTLLNNFHHGRESVNQLSVVSAANNGSETPGNYHQHYLPTAQRLFAYS
jgi:hypothetical protein